MAKFQTLTEFLFMPFGSQTSLAKLEKYKKMYLENQSKIVLNAYTKMEESYYFHVKIPSESQKDGNVVYDVVIRFFTDKPDARSSSHLRDYYIQFFSNSPGFIYNYAVLYKNHGFLIDYLYTKMDPRYFDKLPKKTNVRLELSYDKSIYFTCRFLNERKFKVLNKHGIIFGKKLPPEKFFKEIKDFQSIKIEGEILNLEKKSYKELEKKFNTQTPTNNETQSDTHKKSASNTTAKDKQNLSVVRKTSTNTTSLVKSIVRKTAGKSTVKK